MFQTFLHLRSFNGKSILQRLLPPSGQHTTIPSGNKSPMIQTLQISNSTSKSSPAPQDPTDPAPARSARGGQSCLGSRHLRVPVIITLTAVIRSVFDRRMGLIVIVLFLISLLLPWLPLTMDHNTPGLKLFGFWW